MSKIICDVCGTSYPETANQCPICGCVRPGDAVTVSGDTKESDLNTGTTYTYVKGGRFSKTNVKKRNQGKVVLAAAPQAKEPSNKEDKNDKGMIITVLVLLLAIVAVVIYMTVRFFLPGWLQNDKDPEQSTGSTVNQTVESTDSTVLEIPCQALKVSNTVIEFDKAGAALLLNVTPEPANTTDVITYATSDENVAVISKDGKVIAAGNGQAIITITCGTATAECRVVCTIETKQEEPTVPTYSTEDFKLNRYDFTLDTYGATHKLYNGDIPVELITWTAEDETVATISNGVVSAVGSGYTTVYAEYGDVKLSCIVRCTSNVKAPAGSNDQDTEPESHKYELSHTDVSIKVSESFRINLRDSLGKIVEATFISADKSICTVENGVVTGVGSGTTVVSVTVDGETHICTVRVRIN